MRIQIMIVWLMVMSSTSSACDICGSSGGGDGWGITPNFNRHFIALRANWRSFHNTSGSLEDGDLREGKDSFLRLELTGRYAINSRWQTMLVVPYVQNEHHAEDMHHSIAGPGDVTILGQYLLIKPGSAFPSHACQLSTGVSAPTGKFRFSHDMPSGIQQGSGSWDFQTGVNYMLRMQHMGVQADVLYRFNSAAKGGYDWGDQFSASSRVFANLKGHDGATWMPFVGGTYEYAFPDIENPAYGIEAPFTGGEMLVTNVGVEFYGASAGFGLDAGVPVFCNRAGGSSNMTMQLAGRFIYYIN